MALDPSIALQTQSPNPTNFVSGFLDLGQKKLNLQKSQDTYAADVARSNALSQSAQANATVDTANVQPKIQQQAADTGMAQFKLSGAQAQQSMQLASGLISDPDFVKGNTDGMMEKLGQAQDTMVQQFGVDPKIARATIVTLQNQALHHPEQVRQSLINMTQQQQNGAGQQQSALPNAALVNNGAQTVPVATGNVALTGTAPGSVVGAPIANQVSPSSQEEVQSDAQGNRYVVQKGPSGVILGTRAVPGSTTGAPSTPGAPTSGPVNLPPNETAETRNQLQSERTAAQQAVTSAGTQHQLNREIYGIAEGNVQTATLGKWINNVAGTLGVPGLTPGESGDYNTLGKLLARSNQQLAQGMGPHTNAGLEQTNAANGTTDYDKNTIKKIANLNDALLTGTQMYQKGLETAIQQNGIFGKRQFDQAWGAAMDPDALRLKNAVDNGDKGQIQMLIKQAGGPNSAGAKSLLGKLQTLGALSSTGRP